MDMTYKCDKCKFGCMAEKVMQNHKERHKNKEIQGDLNGEEN